jgi:hypothetical protein
MDWNKAKRCLEGIEASTLDTLRRELIAACVRYAHFRAEWQIATPERRMEMDGGRRLSHNALIDACNILSRNMAGRGEDITWRAELTNNRKEIGDFACYVHAVLGIRAR